ncbi:hypothetical protein YC2023_069967 [Brassica napus]
MKNERKRSTGRMKPQDSVSYLHASWIPMTERVSKKVSKHFPYNAMMKTGSKVFSGRTELLMLVSNPAAYR